MTIKTYLWIALGVILVLCVGWFVSGVTVGRRANKKGVGIIGLIILLVLGILVGGAKSQEARYGPFIVYEAAWLASALNFALAGGYLWGRNARSEKPSRTVPVICGLLSLVSLVLMAQRLDQVTDTLSQLGIGQAVVKPEGPNVSLGCKESLGKLYAGFQHYVEVNDALPPAAKWMDEEDFKGAVQADEWLHCPAVSSRKDAEFGYAYNEALAGRKMQGKMLKDMPDAAKTPLAFDSTNLAKNAYDAIKSLPRPGRHNGRNNVLYCDGHIDSIEPK